jgi:hypothetical protein
MYLRAEGGAMDWDVSVTAPSTPEPPESDFGIAPGGKAGAIDFSPCLYLGPAGQRCPRCATPSGFCARHQPNADSSSTFQGSFADKPLLSPKRVGAILTILALLWPVLADLVRELIRYFR